jgi:sugar phosphate isomerase/epimerase
MSRSYSLAYLTAPTLTPPQSVRLAAQLGYHHVGLRLLPNMAGAPQQFLIDQPAVLRETVAAIQDTGIGVFDLEIIRIGADFDPRSALPLLEVGAALQARALLVAGDDTDLPRLCERYAALCELMKPFGMTADLEFMPWTAVPDAKAALRVVDRAGRPDHAGILVDALHFSRSDSAIADLAAIPRRLLHYAQIADAPTQRQVGRPFTVEEMIHTARCERLLPGEGGIELRPLFNAMPGELPISVEVPNAVRLAQVGQIEWARQALAASRTLLEAQA